MEKKKLNFLKNRKRLAIIFAGLFLVLGVCTGSFLGYKKYKENKNESKQVLSSMQTKLNELQAYKDEQIRLEEEQKRKEESIKEEQEREKLQQCEDKKSECEKKIEDQKKIIQKYEGEYNQAKNSYDALVKEKDEDREKCEDKYDGDDIEEKVKKMKCKKKYVIGIDEKSDYQKKENLLGQAKEGLEAIENECSSYKVSCQ